MKTIKLGDSELEVSTLGLGAMFFGTRNDQASSYQLLDDYFEAGGNFVDTANIYAHWVSGFTGGESEILLGHWLRERRNRSQVILASKTGFEYPGVKRGLTAAGIEEECNKSLKRLQVETIDLYYAHVDDYATPLEETLEAFNRLLTAGKIRAIGASNYLAWRLEQAHNLSQIQGWADYCCVQQRHTYLRIKPGGVTEPQVTANTDLFDYSRRRSFPIVAYSALLAGAYTRSDRVIGDAYIGPDTTARLAALKMTAEEIGATPNQIVIAWMLHSDYPVIPLIAAGTRAQLKENLEAQAIALTSEQMQRLDNASS